MEGLVRRRGKESFRELESDRSDMESQSVHNYT